MCESGSGPSQRYCRVEVGHGAREQAQVGPAARFVPGLVEHLAATDGHLITPDHQGARVAPGDRLGLLGGQPGTAGGGRFPGVVRLLDAGIGHLEGHLEALEQLAAVDRGGGEDQAGRGRHAITKGETRG